MHVTPGPRGLSAGRHWSPHIMLFLGALARALAMVSRGGLDRPCFAFLLWPGGFRTARHRRGPGAGSSRRSPGVPQRCCMPLPLLAGHPPRKGAAVRFRGKLGFLQGHLRETASAEDFHPAGLLRTDSRAEGPPSSPRRKRRVDLSQTLSLACFLVFRVPNHPHESLSLLCLGLEPKPLDPRSRRSPIHHFGRETWLYAGLADRLGDWTRVFPGGRSIQDV